MLFFFKNICVYQKNVVPLHPLLTKSRESVAQQVEHIPFKDGVLGSSPSWFTESSSIAALFIVICSPCLFIFLVPSNKALQFCLQNYCFFLTCARKISLIVPLTKNYLHISKKYDIFACKFGIAFFRKRLYAARSHPLLCHQSGRVEMYLSCT